MFNLKPKISLLETEFIESFKLTQEDIISIKSSIFLKNGQKCSGCGIPNNLRKINIHLITVNDSNPKLSEFVCLCKECHFIEHIDKAIEKKYIKLVNSTLSQSDLIWVCRNKRLSENINNGNIELLKKEPDQFLEELRSGSLGKNRIKVIFSPKNYNWD